MRRGLVLLAIQSALLLMVTARFLYDRATLPRAWARTEPFDPNHWLRGRYVQFRVAPECAESSSCGAGRVQLSIRDGRLVAVPDEAGESLSEPLAFYIAEHVPDPSARPPGEELWVELSIPPKGLPRPVRLGVKRGERIDPTE